MAVNQRDSDGLTPLIKACRAGQVNVVRSLLRHKLIKLDLPDHEGNMPIHIAAVFRQHDILKLLLNKGVDCNAPNKYGESPLHMLCKVSMAVSVQMSADVISTVQDFKKSLDQLFKSGTQIKVDLMSDFHRLLDTYDNTDQLGDSQGGRCAAMRPTSLGEGGQC